VHPQRKNKTGAREIHRLSHLVLRSVEESECAVGQRARVGKGAAVEAGVQRGRGYGAEQSSLGVLLHCCPALPHWLPSEEREIKMHVARNSCTCISMSSSAAEAECTATMRISAAQTPRAQAYRTILCWELVQDSRFYIQIRCSIFIFDVLYSEQAVMFLPKGYRGKRDRRDQAARPNQ